MPGLDQEQQRLDTLLELGLLEFESVPVFEEATQTAAHLLNVPVCILGIIDRDRQWLKSAIGLSRMGLMNDLAASRQIPRQEAFCTCVVESRQVLVISDTAAHPAFASGLLTQRYGIRAYLGVPLLAANGCCLGTLAVMSVSPHEFTDRDVETLELIARWCISEFERNRLLKQQSMLAIAPSEQMQSDYALPAPAANAVELPLISTTKANLIAQMTQELRTPLTSILGMAGILNREIYGPLTDKQKEYMDIVHNSGQYLLSLVNEILELGALDDRGRQLDRSPVDIEMLCQQVLNTLAQAAERREQELRLTIEPGSRIWLLDKDKVRQMLYHLIFSIIQSSSADSMIRVHVSRKRRQLSLAIWTSHPWLGEGLPQAVLAKQGLSVIPPLLEPNDSVDFTGFTEAASAENYQAMLTSKQLHSGSSQLVELVASPELDSRQSLGLMLSQQLAELQGGRLRLQGTPDLGYRYVVSLPQILEDGTPSTL